MASPAATTKPVSLDWKWAGIFLLASSLLGVMTFAIPPYWIILAAIAFAIMAWLAMHPEKIFYLVVFTIPFTDRVRILPVSFSVNDLMILFCLGVCIIHAVVRDQKFSLRTVLDPWLVVLSGMFFLAGVFSEGDSGVLGFLKIFEAVVVYYLAVYLVRTRQITRSQVLKCLIWTAMFQAALGLFQSLTGIGSNFDSYRGYLGYLGLGSNHVWHGRGTTWHFNALGNYLATNLMIFLPVFYFISKKKPQIYLTLAIIIFGLITTYSRGSLLGLGAGLIYLLAVSQPTMKRSLKVVGAFILVIAPIVWYFSHTSYVETVSYEGRLEIWKVPLAAITNSDKAFWFGNGLNSYEAVAWPFIPSYVLPDQYHNWFAHNFYLLTVVEVGVVGALIFFGFLLWLLVDTFRKYKQWHGMMSVYSLGISSALVTIFFISIFDHSFASPYFKIFLFLLLGLLYVKRNPVSPKPRFGD